MGRLRGNKNQSKVLSTKRPGKHTEKEKSSIMEAANLFCRLYLRSPAPSRGIRGAYGLKSHISSAGSSETRIIPGDQGLGAVDAPKQR